MIPITILVHPKLKDFLDRYYDIKLEISDRFFMVLEEGSIVQRGKAFYLSIQSQEDLKIAIEEQTRAELQAYRDNQPHI